MTRETKIGLLLGLGVILLIGIIISDQLSQVQKDPADFTQFAEDSQRTIDNSDAIPAADDMSSPEYGPGYQPAGAPSGGGTPAHDVPNEFYIPKDTRDTPTQRQASNTPGSDATGQQPPAAFNVDNNSDQTIPPPKVVDVPTVRFGDDTPTTPMYAQPGTSPSADRDTVTRSNQPTSIAAGSSVIHHQVVPGDSLSKLARRYYGDDGYWRAIALANPGKVGPDGQVNVGVVLDIPKREDAELGRHVESIGHETVRRVGVRGAMLPTTITVQSGDTLSELAAKHLGSASRWDELLEANKDKLDSPESLQVGMKLRLPPGSVPGSNATAASNVPASIGNTRSANSTGDKTYTVKPGDSLTSIADQMLGDGRQWEWIYETNRDKLKSPDRLIVGQKLIIKPLVQLHEGPY